MRSQKKRQKRSPVSSTPFWAGWVWFWGLQKCRIFGRTSGKRRFYSRAGHRWNGDCFCGNLRKRKAGDRYFSRVWCSAKYEPESGRDKAMPHWRKEIQTACGHSALAAGTVGAAIIAKEYLKETGKTGTVKIFGCPAEETGFGNRFMVKRGCFEGLDMCFTWHPMDHTSLWGRTLAYYKVRFDFKGITAHAGGAP